VKEQWRSFIQTHSKALAGVAIGLVCALLLFALGFWKTVLLAILAAAGLSIGMSLDRGESISDVFLRWGDRIHRAIEAIIAFFKRIGRS